MPDRPFSNGFDFQAAVGAPFRMQPGLRPLPEGAPQLTPLRPGSRAQREKLAVLSAWWAEALVDVPGFDATPGLAALSAHAASEHPTHWAWNGERAIAPRLSLAVTLPEGRIEPQGRGSFGLGDELGRCLHGLPPRWRLAGLLSLAFLEDFAIIDGTSGQVPWMAVALPSHWAPQDKVGRHFGAIHAPVADNRLLVQAGPGLMQLVCGPRRWERFVWTITDQPRLHAHPRRSDPARWAEPDGDTIPHRAWWRSERQTFIPVPEVQQAVFTIAVDVQPLAQVVHHRDRARHVAAALASMSPAVLDYRGLVPVREALLAWLDTIAADQASRP